MYTFRNIHQHTVLGNAGSHLPVILSVQIEHETLTDDIRVCLVHSARLFVINEPGVSFSESVGDFVRDDIRRDQGIIFIVAITKHHLIGARLNRRDLILSIMDMELHRQLDGLRDVHVLLIHLHDAVPKIEGIAPDARCLIRFVIHSADRGPAAHRRVQTAQIDGVHSVLVQTQRD